MAEMGVLVWRRTVDGVGFWSMGSSTGIVSLGRCLRLLAN